MERHQNLQQGRVYVRPELQDISLDYMSQILSASDPALSAGSFLEDDDDSHFFN